MGVTVDDVEGKAGRGGVDVLRGDNVGAAIEMAPSLDTGESLMLDLRFLSLLLDEGVGLEASPDEEAPL